MYLKKSIFNSILGLSLFAGSSSILFAAPSCPVTIPYSPIFDTYYANESEAIQHQFVWQELLGYFPTHFEVPVIKDLKISLKPQYSYSKADSRTPIYGYHKNGKLDVNGGVKKSYNKDFNNFKLRYHAALESKYPGDNPGEVVTQTLNALTPKTIENIYSHNVPYFHERGLDIQGADTFKKFDNQFVYTLSLSALENVAIRLIWDQDGSSSSSSKKQKIKYVDLHASTSGLYDIDTYEKNPSKYKLGNGYPTRIRVTTNFCKFQENVNVSPIAFYDKKKQVLTIHVPNTDDPIYFLTANKPYTGNPDLDYEGSQYLAGFDGSFKTFKRDKNGTLKPTSIDKATVFAQVSDIVYIRNRFDSPDVDPEFEEIEDPINFPVLDDDVLSYTGVVLNQMNGGSKAYDNYALPVPILNAYEGPEDPLKIPHQTHRGTHYSSGDNPRTKIHEKFGGSSAITCFDYDLWNSLALKLPLDVVKGKTSYPENVSTTVIPSAVSEDEAYITVLAHEFWHQSQVASGTLFFAPTEALAVGIELDPHVSNGVFLPLRSGLFTRAMLDTFRGKATPMSTQLAFFPSYGMGMWWKYVQDQFDYNNQVTRRTVDVLANKTAGPLMQKNDFPDSYVAPVINTSGGTAALNKALNELFGKNIKDVWNDYSISVTLLRNNKSIPKEWRNYFPYWIYNTNYAGYAEIQAATAEFNFDQFANFWEVMDTNGTVPANYGSGYTGETFIPTLPPHFEADALSLATYAFNVPLLADGGPGAIFVTVPKGEWKVTLVQFTSDGTKEGSFIADGSHSLDADGNNAYIFDIAGHSPAYSETGNLRLICVNTTFDSNGKELADYFDTQLPNASIIIDAPVM